MNRPLVCLVALLCLPAAAQTIASPAGAGTTAENATPGVRAPDRIVGSRATAGAGTTSVDGLNALGALLDLGVTPAQARTLINPVRRMQAKLAELDRQRRVAERQVRPYLVTLRDRRLRGAAVPARVTDALASYERFLQQAELQRQSVYRAAFQEVAGLLNPGQQAFVAGASGATGLPAASFGAPGGTVAAPGVGGTAGAGVTQPGATFPQPGIGTPLPSAKSARTGELPTLPTAGAALAGPIATPADTAGLTAAGTAANTLAGQTAAGTGAGPGVQEIAARRAATLSAVTGLLRDARNTADPARFAAAAPGAVANQIALLTGIIPGDPRFEPLAALFLNRLQQAYRMRPAEFLQYANALANELAGAVMQTVSTGQAGAATAPGAFGTGSLAAQRLLRALQYDGLLSVLEQVAGGG